MSSTYAVIKRGGRRLIVHFQLKLRRNNRRNSLQSTEGTTTSTCLDRRCAVSTPGPSCRSFHPRRPSLCFRRKIASRSRSENEVSSTFSRRWVTTHSSLRRKKMRILSKTSYGCEAPMNSKGSKNRCATRLWSGVRSPSTLPSPNNRTSSRCLQPSRPHSKNAIS